MSLEAGSPAARHPPPRSTLQTTCHVPLMLQPLPQSQPDDGSTPQNGRRDPRSHQRHTGWTGYGGDYRPLCPNAVSTICAIPAGTGYDGNYRPLCPNTVPTISRPLEASAPYTKVSAILGIVPAETPPPWCSLDTDQVSASRAVRLQWLARPSPHPLRGSPEALTTHRIGWDWHAAPVLQGRTTLTATPPQE